MSLNNPNTYDTDTADYLYFEQYENVRRGYAQRVLTNHYITPSAGNVGLSDNIANISLTSGGPFQITESEITDGAGVTSPATVDWSEVSATE